MRGQLLQRRVVQRVSGDKPLPGSGAQYVGAPHFYVLDARSWLLEPFNTGLLEQGKRYDEATFGSFIDHCQRQRIRI